MPVVLPISNVVDVNITTLTSYPSRQGFGTTLIFAPEERTSDSSASGFAEYFSMSELAAEWGATTEVYQAALALFSQNPRPINVKVSWYDPLANTAVEKLDETESADSDWYWLCVSRDLRDDAETVNIAGWVEANRKRFIVTSNDPDMIFNPTNPTVATQLQDLGYNRSHVFYQDSAVPEQYPCAASIGVMSTVDLNKPNSSKTWKFKTLAGIEPANINSSDLIKITGFVPGVGKDASQGRYANTYVNIGGVNIVAEGLASSGEYLDVLHGVDWLEDAIAKEILGVLKNTPKIPYTNAGVQKLVDAVQFVLRQAVSNGLIAADLDEDGNYVPEFTVIVQRVEDVPASQRASRIAPDIQFFARLAGAVHYASVTGTLTI